MLRTTIKTTVATSAAAAVMMFGPHSAVSPVYAMQLNKPKPKVNIPRPHVHVRPPRVRVPVETSTRRLIEHKRHGDDSGSAASRGGGSKAGHKRIAPLDDTDVANVPVPRHRPAVHTAALPKTDPRRANPRFEGLMAKTGGPARLQELGRLKKQQDGGLEAGAGAFGGEGDCRDFGGHASIGIGCGDGEQEKAASPNRNRHAGLGYGPWGQDSNTKRPPRPSADNGTPEPDSSVHPGRASARGEAGIKDFGQGQAQSGGGIFTSCGQWEAAGYGCTSGHKGRRGEGDKVLKAWGRDSDGNRFTHRERESEDGSRTLHHAVFYEDGWRSTDCDESGECTSKDHFYKPYEAPDTNSSAEEVEGGENGGGDAGQPNPIDIGGGNNSGAGADCLTLGIRCDVAKKESKTLIDEEKTRKNRITHDHLTPREIFEMVGQPMPAPGRDQAADKGIDRSGVAGLTPGCDATPEGCGDTPATGSTAAASDAAGLHTDNSIAGFEPIDPRDPHH